MNKIKIFLSYASEDKLIIETLVNMLKQYNIESFVAHINIESGKKWAKEIKNAIEESQLFLAVITKNFNNSQYTDQEIGIALGNNKPIIPIRLDDHIILRGFMSEIQANKFTINSTDDLIKLVNRINDECIHSDDLIHVEKNNINNTDYLYKKFNFDNTKSYIFGVHEELELIKLVDYIYGNSHNYLNWAKINYPMIFFTSQPHKNLESSYDESDNFFKKLSNGKKMIIDKNIMNVHPMEMKTLDTNYKRYASSYAEKAEYLQHYENGSIVQAFTEPIIKLYQELTYLRLDDITMSLILFMLICRDYYNHIRYNGKCTIGIAIKESKNMYLSNYMLNNQIHDVVNNLNMRDESHVCNHTNVYIEHTFNISTLNNAQILNVTKRLTDKILFAHKYDTNASIFDQDCKLNQKYFDYFNRNRQARL